LVGKLKGRQKHRREHNIRMGLREIRLEGMDWIHLAQDKNQWWAVVNRAMKLLLHKRRGVS
jgi:hypothetical protein